ncbi:MAG: maleylpyruvate isomerase N-terminal domain-containing protein [Ferruginibacter sp.]
MADEKLIPIDVVDLLPQLDSKLLELLRSLSPQEWQQQTIAKWWKVKDVAAHLLDGNIRIVSMLRDNYYGEEANIRSKQDLLDFLNRLNADWVKAMQRVSPEMLILLHEITGPLYYNYYKSLDPFDKAGFAVDWAGEQESKNWMHIAREYTEKWLHQQQIRDAVNNTELMTRHFYYPFIDTFMMALPYTYRDITTAAGTCIQLTVTSAAGGDWFLIRANNKWELKKDTPPNIDTAISIDPAIAWKLLSKSIRPAAIRDRVIITGNEKLGETALTMVSVMA